MVVFTGRCVRSLHATVEPGKKCNYCVFHRKEKVEQLHQNGPEVTEAGLVKMMFVFMTGKTKDGLETLLIWFLVIMKWRRWRK